MNGRNRRLTPLSESELVPELRYKGSAQEVKAGTGYKGRMQIHCPHMSGWRQKSQSTPGAEGQEERDIKDRSKTFRCFSGTAINKENVELC